jgi:hypothetical protein
MKDTFHVKKFPIKRRPQNMCNQHLQVQFSKGRKTTKLNLQAQKKDVGETIDVLVKISQLI